MKKTVQRKRQTSLIRQLKRRLLTIAGLLVFVLIFFFPAGIVNASRQHTLDEQQVALQQDQSGLLLSMVNQETGLRGYIDTDNIIFLQPFTAGRPQYLLSVQDIQKQTQSSNFTRTATALAQVEARANAWYDTYALVQIKNMQSGSLAAARSESTLATGKALFDQFRASATQLKAASAQDVRDRQFRLDLNNRLALIIGIVLSFMALLMLWFTFARLIKALTAQLTVLETATNQLGSGDRAARVQELRYHELNKLGQTFNAMAEELAQRSREVERTNRELRDQRDELITLNTALEEANRARSQFLSTMSHELRTPLASIIGFSQLLLDDETETQRDRRQQDNLQRILRNGQHLLSLVNDVLDLEKIEAGQMDVAYEQVDVKELLTSVVEETQSIAIARNVVLRADIEEDVDSLMSNTVKLRQVLLNLVSNALKFTEQGEVTVSARREPASERLASSLVFAVKDTGIGIPVEMQARIFDAFYQVDGGYTRKAGGTGLGLSIVRQLVTLLGGSVEVNSTPGQGSTFTVILPVQPAQAKGGQDIPRLHSSPQQSNPPTASDSASSAAGVIHEQESSTEPRKVVLVVDDNPDTILLIEDALRNTPYMVVSVRNPLLVMELTHKTRPCAITLDVMMPDLNGWQLLHQLKDNPATASIPVLMLTVLAERSTGYVLGADDYLIKPFHREALLAALERHIAKSIGLRRSVREAQPVSQWQK